MTAPLVAHIVHRFDYGGLENGLVNLINRVPHAAVRHVVIALTEATDIAKRIERRDVAVYSLGKRAGKDLCAYVRLFRLLRTLGPDIVHTRNLATLDCQLVALLAGTKRRLHSEHGWDIYDPDGRSSKYRWLRRVVSLFVHRFIALSRELERWLIDDVKISERKVERICNGVDTERFRPSPAKAASSESLITVGTVTRLSPIKDPLNTIDAFAMLIARGVEAQLIVVGDGELRESLQRRVAEHGLQGRISLPGAVLDVAPYLEQFDVFVLGSRREGISNTLLEAMACGIPIVATRTGGNVELVDDGVTGLLVSPSDPNGLAEALERYALNASLARHHGEAGRRRAEQEFSLDEMIRRYQALYTSPGRIHTQRGYC